MLDVLMMCAALLAGVFIGAYLSEPKRDNKGRFTK